MRKVNFLMLCSTLILLSTSTVYATTVVDNTSVDDYEPVPTPTGPSTGSESSGSSGGGEGDLNPSDDTGNGYNVWIDNQFQGYNPKVTEIYSGNNLLLKDNQRYYNPKLEDLDDDLASYIGKECGFGVVYDGYFDMNHKEVYKGSSSSRALEILGYDFLLKSESMDKGKYSNEKLGGSIDLKTAVMDLYKAYNQEFFTYVAVKKSTPNYDMSKSPLQAMITVNTWIADTSYANTYVYITRTNPKQYWEQAVKDGIVVEDQELKAMTVADFCVYAQKVMDLFGEPVITDTESNYLMQVYGKDLPYNLSPKELDAVKYLIVRGIALPEYSYDELLTKDIFYDMLMRIKDINSRETFKNIEFQYDESMLSEGYYPTQVTTAPVPLTLHEGSVSTDVSAATTYDYFIKVLPNVTTFDETVGMSPVVAEDFNIGEEPNKIFSDEMYQGIEVIDGERWIHMKIPCDIKANYPDAVNAFNYITIFYPEAPNCKFRVKLGGGWYYEYRGNPRVFSQRKFQATDNETWVDSARKTVAQNSSTTELSLDNDKKTTVTFNYIGTDYDKITYKKKSISKVKSCTITEVDGSKDTYSITLTAKATFDDIVANINFEKAQSSSTVFEAFGKLNDTYLVSLDYLYSVGLVSQKGSVYGSKEVYRLITPQGNVYINMSNHTVIVGQTVYEVPKSEELYYKDANGKEYVNYRAAIGWTSEVFGIKAADDGSVHIVAKDSSPNMIQHKCSIRPLTGNGMSLTGKNIVPVDTVNCWVGSKKGNWLPMSETYSLANYMVFKSTYTLTGGANDYLFVFTLNDDGEVSKAEKKADKEARDVLSSRVGITVSKDWIVYCYLLYEDNSHRSKAPLDQIQYIRGLGYCYNIQDVTDTSTYYTKRTTILPLVTDTRNSGQANIADLNINRFALDGSTLKLGEAPSIFVDKTDLHLTVMNAFRRTIIKDSSKGLTSKTNIQILEAAPTGIVAKLTSAPDVKYTTYNNCQVYIGTLPIRVLYDKGSNSYVFKITSQLTVNDPVPADAKRYTPLEVSTGKTSLGFIMTDAITFSDIGITDAIGSVLKQAGAAFGQVDWNKYKLNALLNSTDDFLSIVLIVVLNFMPRIGISLFFLLIALCFVKDFKPWVLFCDKVIDPYKILTLNRKDVHTIHVTPLFFMSILGVGIFGLFYDGTILLAMQWFARFFGGVFAR